MRERLLFMFLVVPLVGAAQVSNLQAYEQLIVACLGEVPAGEQAFLLASPQSMTYLRPALTGYWREAGHEVHLEGERLPQLHFQVEAAQVNYGREVRGRVERAVSLSVHYTFTAADGRLLREERCARVHTDTIRVSQIAALEDASFPETRGAAPEAGVQRRYLEPVLLIGAVAISAFLFFSMRSRQPAE